MATGYTRQSSAQIVNLQTSNASDFNNEYNLIQSAFDAVIGHTHDGTTGGGASIPAAGLNTTQNWAAITATFQDNKWTMQNNLDTTKRFVFSAASISTGQLRTITIPDVNDTLVTLTATQILSNKTFTGATITVNDNAFTIQNSADTTKQVKFSLVGITTGTVRTLFIPDATDTLVTLTAGQTLTNKTLSAPNIASPTISNPVITNPAISGGGTLSGTFTGGTLAGTTISSNPTIAVQANKFSLVDQTDATKVALFSCASLSTASNRTYTLPDISDTLVTLTATQTLTNKTITGATLTPSSFIVNDNAFTLQDQGDNTKKAQFDAVGITTGTTRTYTFPDTSDTLVTLAATQTLTNKTLTAPVIATITNTGTITIPATTDTLVARATVDTLTNKTLDNTSIISVKASNLTIQDQTDTTKHALFSAASITTGTTRTYTLPDTSDTVVTLAATQTLTNKTITNGVFIGGPVLKQQVFTTNGTFTTPVGTNTNTVFKFTVIGAGGGGGGGLGSPGAGGGAGGTAIAWGTGVAAGTTCAVTVSNTGGTAGSGTGNGGAGANSTVVFSGVTVTGGGGGGGGGSASPAGGAGGVSTNGTINITGGGGMGQGAGAVAGSGGNSSMGSGGAGTGTTANGNNYGGGAGGGGTGNSGGVGGPGIVIVEWMQ